MLAKLRQLFGVKLEEDYSSCKEEGESIKDTRDTKESEKVPFEEMPLTGTMMRADAAEFVPSGKVQLPEASDSSTKVYLSAEAPEFVPGKGKTNDDIDVFRVLIIDVVKEFCLRNMMRPDHPLSLAARNQLPIGANGIVRPTGLALSLFAAEWDRFYQGRWDLKSLREKFGIQKLMPFLQTIEELDVVGTHPEVRVRMKDMEHMALLSAERAKKLLPTAFTPSVSVPVSMQCAPMLNANPLMSHPLASVGRDSFVPPKGTKEILSPGYSTFPQRTFGGIQSSVHPGGPRQQSSGFVPQVGAEFGQRHHGSSDLHSAVHVLHQQQKAAAAAANLAALQAQYNQALISAATGLTPQAFVKALHRTSLTGTIPEVQESHQTAATRVGPMIDESRVTPGPVPSSKVLAPATSTPSENWRPGPSISLSQLLEQSPCTTSSPDGTLSRSDLQRLLYNLVSKCCDLQSYRWEAREDYLSDYELDDELVDTDPEDNDEHMTNVEDKFERRRRRQEERKKRREALRANLADEMGIIPEETDETKLKKIQERRNRRIGMLVSAIKTEWSHVYGERCAPLAFYMSYFGIKKLKYLLLEVRDLMLVGDGGFMRVTTTAHAMKYCKPFPPPAPVYNEDATAIAILTDPDIDSNMASTGIDTVGGRVVQGSVVLTGVGAPQHQGLKYHIQRLLYNLVAKKCQHQQLDMLKARADGDGPEAEEARPVLSKYDELARQLKDAVDNMDKPGVFNLPMGSSCDDDRLPLTNVAATVRPLSSSVEGGDEDIVRDKKMSLAQPHEDDKSSFGVSEPFSARRCPPPMIEVSSGENRSSLGGEYDESSSKRTPRSEGIMQLLHALPEAEGIAVYELKAEWYKAYGCHLQPLMENAGFRKISRLVHTVPGIRVIGKGSEMRCVVNQVRTTPRSATTTYAPNRVALGPLQPSVPKLSPVSKEVGSAFGQTTPMQPLGKELFKRVPTSLSLEEALGFKSTESTPQPVKARHQHIISKTLSQATGPTRSSTPSHNVPIAKVSTGDALIGGAGNVHIPHQQHQQLVSQGTDKSHVGCSLTEDTDYLEKFLLAVVQQTPTNSTPNNKSSGDSAGHGNNNDNGIQAVGDSPGVADLSMGNLLSQLMAGESLPILQEPVVNSPDLGSGTSNPMSTEELLAFLQGAPDVSVGEMEGCKSSVGSGDLHQQGQREYDSLEMLEVKTQMRGLHTAPHEIVTLKTALDAGFLRCKKEQQLSRRLGQASPSQRPTAASSLANTPVRTTCRTPPTRQF